MTQDQHKLPEPTAFVWHQHLGERTKSLRWTKPNQWEYAEKVEPLYTEAQVRELLSAHLQQRPLPVREGTDENLEPAPPNSLPSWSECALRVDNSEYIAKRVAEGGYGAEADTMLATELHRFIYEYDDADPYRSAWFLHRLELLLNEVRASPSLPVREEPTDANEAYEQGWRMAAHWAEREDLYADIDSPRYLKDRDEALAASSPSVQNMGEGETGKDGVKGGQGG